MTAVLPAEARRILEDVAALGACSRELVLQHVIDWDLPTRAERALADDMGGVAPYRAAGDLNAGTARRPRWRDNEFARVAGVTP